MTIEKTKDDNILKRLLHSQMIIPLAALLALVVFNLIADPSFFAITVNQDSTGNSVLAGQLISILNNGSELAILAIGMTLVTAGHLRRRHDRRRRLRHARRALRRQHAP